MSDPGRKRITLYQALRERSVVVRGLWVALIVGTLLTFINQGDVLLAGQWPPLWKILLTFLVPYGVSTYSSAAHMAGGTRE